MKKRKIRFMVSLNGRKLPLYSTSKFKFLCDVASLRMQYGQNVHVIKGSIKVS